MYLVFDVGATTIKCALMNAEGEIQERKKVPTPVAKDDTIESFVEALGTVYDLYKKDATIEGIAIGLPGQVDVKKGIVYNGGGIRYLRVANLRDLIEARCNNIPVSVENDGKCAALAEVWKGNAKDVKDACVFVFGTGIGGALIKNKKVIHGKHLLAGEVSVLFDGMTRQDLKNVPEDKDGIIEDMSVMDSVDNYPYLWTNHAATLNVCHWVAKKRGLEDSEVTGEKLYQWAAEGDQEIIDTLEDWYFCIAKQCLNVYVTFNPEIILIGGGISAEPQFVNGIIRYVERLKRISRIFKDVKVDCCKFYNDSNLLGALYNFKQQHNLLK